MACNNFVFVGDTEIGSRISQSLIEGGLFYSSGAS